MLSSCINNLFCFHLLTLLFLSCNSYTNDLDVLLKLKSSMVGETGKGLNNWEPSSSPVSHCSFSGVSCDHEFRVVSLNISFSGLNGSLPTEIGLLDKLVNLTVSGNNLSGGLPVEMSKLTELKLLNISGNGFRGKFPGEVLIGMTKLEVLDAYNNNFTGSLPGEIVSLENLKHLHLGGNYFTGEIPVSYGDIYSLEYLGLNGIGLTGKTPTFLSKLRNLKELYVGYFNVYQGGIPPEFGDLTELRVLDMASCSLSGEIPTSLGNLRQLHSLFLQLNNLTGFIPPELSGLLSLKSLDLSLNSFVGEIPATFSVLQNLTLINIFNNKLFGKIPDFLGDYPFLEVFQVWGNNFTLELPENLGRNGRLLMLDVAENHFTGLIPPDLCKGGKLKTLILMDNFFFGPLPEELGRCKSLIRIRASNNFFNGTIPAGLFNLPAALMIDLSDNYFSGELPETMSSSTLGLLSLSNNWITGHIPPSIGNFQSLQVLSIEMNRLSGQIPPEIFNLQHVTGINISANNISGDIPSSISRCSASLISIDFSKNNLSGELPNGMDNLRNLGTLNLSRNHLKGKIPRDLRNMTSLTVLDFSYNDLYGKVPTGGQFVVFNETSFAGNPYLCLPHHTVCPVVPNEYQTGNHYKTSVLTSKAKVIITIIVVTTIVVLFAVTFYQLRKRNHDKKRVWKLTAFQRLEFRAENVLECLKNENIIGKGGAGVVYLGSMKNGIDVAIKRLAGRGKGKHDHGFSAEIQTLGKIRHRNIVRLLGYVSNHDTNLLLYEYMSNGSLGELLHGPKGGHLSWETRYRIAVEAAKGLCYLHHDCSPLIIHRDVKSNNILLDSNFEAHVADFGLAKFLQDDGASECMSSIAGSYGYIAPEYAYTLKVDTKTDVYSFGVVLLELIAGKKPVGEFGDGVDIVRWVKETTSELPQPLDDAATVSAIVDRRLNAYPLTDAVHLFKIAMMCVEDESSCRPTMREVVHLLTNPPRCLIKA